MTFRHHSTTYTYTNPTGNLPSGVTAQTELFLSLRNPPAENEILYRLCQ